jgi:hypothetical protein
MRKKRNVKVKKTIKGELIKGMTKRLPWEILEDPIFKKRLKEIMKDFSGIYALYRRDRLYYVGLTKDLFGRIKGHLKNRHRGKWDSFIIFRIKRVKYLKDIETLITHLVNVPGNRQKGRVPRDADINQILQYILRQQKKKTAVYEKVFEKR